MDREIVLRRIELIREYAGILKELLEVPEEAFVEDRDVYLKAERCLELVIQAMLDIGNHIISDREFQRPSRYEDIFEILGENRVTTKELAARLRGLGGLRNILVHAYLQIDRARIRQELVGGIDHFEEYVKQVLEFLERSGPG